MLKHDTIRRDLLMTREEGQSWHQFKAQLGPIYPGYESFDVYMKWMWAQLENYGCVDFLEHHWTHESYRVNDWPNHDSGALGLTVDGEEIPVATFLMLSPSTGQAGLDGDLLYYDSTKGAPEEGAFQGRIVVMEEIPMPGKPFDNKFLESYVVTDTNYRSDPQPPAAMLEIPDPQVNNSWFTRWAFSQWLFTLIDYAVKGKAAGFIIVSRLTYGALEGLYDRQKRHNIPSLVLDRVNGQKVLAAAKAGKRANLKIISEFFPADAWNFVCFLPGAHYGTDRDQQICINTHVDAMSLTQDNGSLGALGVVRYFAQLPQEQRQKTLLICVDSRHFIEGFESGNVAHDPYVVYPQLREKLTASLGLEHMGEMEAAEDFAHNTMVPTGRPEYTFMVADDNDYCARLLIRSAVDSGLERADVKINGRPGIHGMYKGLVRAVQAKTHNLGVCILGQAGNWCGAHTQTFSTMQYFGAEKFAAEVALWTEVVDGLMRTDSAVYDICWDQLNGAIRAAHKAGTLSPEAKEGLLLAVASIFRDAEDGEFALAALRLEKEVLPAVALLSAQADLSAVSAAAAAVAARLRKAE